MNDVTNINFFSNIKSLILKNIKSIMIIFFLLLISFISYQIYTYYKFQNLKKTSIEFFSLINDEEINSEIFNDIKKSKGIFSFLSSLKQIKINNNNGNFSASNKIYKEIISNNNLETLYISSVAAHASYILINASYNENTIKYVDDISFYIDNINDDLENFTSLKKELQYLLKVTEIDLNNINYNNNSELVDLYNEILNSDIISSSIKERVKKIHEFHLYK